jgi:hypothetical protein
MKIPKKNENNYETTINHIGWTYQRFPLIWEGPGKHEIDRAAAELSQPIENV